MSKLGSLYIKLGSPDGELEGCCETADWAAEEIERLQTVLRQLIAATELHHRNPMDLENRDRYNQAKCHAKQAIGMMIPNALGQEPCADVCARSPVPTGYTAGD